MLRVDQEALLERREDRTCYTAGSENGRRAHEPRYTGGF